MYVHEEIDLSFGIRDGKLVFIDEVERGLECGCFCPNCGGKLIAKKGEVNQHHFAHYQVENCGKGVETALHLLGKQALLEEKRLRLPGGEAIELISEVEIEKRRFGYVADISAVVTSTGMDIDVEIKVTHGIDEDKLEKIVTNDAQVIEIDLSALLKDGGLTREKIIQQVVTDAPRIWAVDLQEKQDQDENMTNKNLICGFKAASGYSHKNQSSFEFAALNVLVQQEGRSSANYQIHGIGGYEQTALPMKFDDQFLAKLKGITYPVYAELVFDMCLVKGKLKPVVCDLII